MYLRCCIAMLFCLAMSPGAGHAQNCPKDTSPIIPQLRSPSLRAKAYVDIDSAIAQGGGLQASAQAIRAQIAADNAAVGAYSGETKEMVEDAILLNQFVLDAIQCRMRSSGGSSSGTIRTYRPGNHDSDDGGGSNVYTPGRHSDESPSNVYVPHAREREKPKDEDADLDVRYTSVATRALTPDETTQLNAAVRWQPSRVPMAVGQEARTSLLDGKGRRLAEIVLTLSSVDESVSPSVGWYDLTLRNYSSCVLDAQGEVLTQHEIGKVVSAATWLHWTALKQPDPGLERRLHVSAVFGLPQSTSLALRPSSSPISQCRTKVPASK